MGVLSSIEHRRLDERGWESPFEGVRPPIERVSQSRVACSSEQDTGRPAGCRGDLCQSRFGDERLDNLGSVASSPIPASIAEAATDPAAGTRRLGVGELIEQGRYSLIEGFVLLVEATRADRPFQVPSTP